MTNTQAAERQAKRECLVTELVEALQSTRQWLNGDKWRYDDDPVRRQCWQDQIDAIDDVLARAKEQQQ